MLGLYKTLSMDEHKFHKSTINTHVFLPRIFYTYVNISTDSFTDCVLYSIDIYQFWRRKYEYFAKQTDSCHVHINISIAGKYVLPRE